MEAERGAAAAAGRAEMKSALLLEVEWPKGDLKDISSSLGHSRALLKESRRYHAPVRCTKVSQSLTRHAHNKEPGGRTYRNMTSNMEAQVPCVLNLMGPSGIV